MGPSKVLLSFCMLCSHVMLTLCQPVMLSLSLIPCTHSQHDLLLACHAHSHHTSLLLHNLSTLSPSSSCLSNFSHSLFSSHFFLHVFFPTPSFPFISPFIPSPPLCLSLVSRCNTRDVQVGSLVLNPRDTATYIFLESPWCPSFSIVARAPQLPNKSFSVTVVFIVFRWFNYSHICTFCFEV